MSKYMRMGENQIFWMNYLFDVDERRTIQMMTNKRNRERARATIESLVDRKLVDRIDTPARIFYCINDDGRWVVESWRGLS